jgi:hypothetical protein
LFDPANTAAQLPWYGYLAIGLVVIFIAQTIGKVATKAIKSIEEETKEL